MDPSNMSSASLLRSWFLLVRLCFAICCESKWNSLSYFKALYRNLDRCNPYLIFHGQVVAKILSRNSRPRPLCCFMWLVSAKNSVTAMKTWWEFMHLRALGPSFVIVEFVVLLQVPSSVPAVVYWMKQGRCTFRNRREDVFFVVFLLPWREEKSKWRDSLGE